MTEQLKNQIKSISEKYKWISRVVLFGSRARKDNRERSDIDLAVYGISSEDQQYLFKNDLENINSLLTFDVLFISSNTNSDLLQNIKNDGVIIMNKFEIKFKNFKKSIKRLNESIEYLKNNNTGIIRDGVIQRFEFTTELAWKTTREYLIDQGFLEINSPKAVIKKAYSCGLINDEIQWLNLLNDRNLTSHIYDENICIEICKRISNHYVFLFSDLLDKMSI